MDGPARNPRHDALGLELPFADAPNGHPPPEPRRGLAPEAFDSPFAGAGEAWERPELGEGQAEELEEGPAPCGGDESHEAPDLPVLEAWTKTAGFEAFRDRVLARHLEISRKAHGAPLPDLGEGELATIPTTAIKTKPDTAQAAGRLLATARADLAHAQAQGDAKALAVKALSVTSGYRGSAHQRELWRKYFPKYYRWTEAARDKLAGGPHGEAAVAYMLRPKAQGGFGLAGRVAAPGYSNHQNGIAIDFLQTLANGSNLGNDSDEVSRQRWRDTWFHAWLLANALTYGFRPLATEEWHWEHRAAKTPAPTPARAAARPPAPQAAPLAGALWTYAPPGGTKVAVYLPKAAQGASRLEILIYVHGLLGPCGVPASPPADLIGKSPFNLGRIVEATGRPMAILAPLFQLGDDRSWSAHGLDSVAGLNGLLDSALAEIAGHRGGPAPTLERVVVAGHSRAYGVLYRLAKASADPALSEGPMAKLSHLWLLDASYGTFPSKDFNALATAHPGLSVDVVYRKGSATDKFGGRAAGGRLSLKPLPHATVTHCAVPAWALPGLLAGLPGAAHGEAEGAQDEDLAWLDLEAALETEEEALGADREGWIPSGEAQGGGLFAQDEADAAATVGLEGPAAEAFGGADLGERLAAYGEALDEAEASGRFDEFEDERDADWESDEAEETGEALEPPGFGEMEAAGALATSGLTPAERKAVLITSTLETGKPGGFYGLSGNFDGQGLSFGLVNWTIGTGSLQPLLLAFAAEHPDRWAAVFGPEAASFLELLRRKDKDALRAQHQFAIEQMNTLTVKGHRRTWSIRQPWASHFRRLSEDPAFQQIQVRFVRRLLARADAYCQVFKLKSEQAFAFMFDAVSSHGAGWLDKRFKGVPRRRQLLTPRLQALAAQFGEGQVPEARVLEAIAAVLAATSAPRWAEKVRVRKLWFVTGQHSRSKELAGLEPRPDLPYTVSTRARGPAPRRETEADLGAQAFEDLAAVRAGAAPVGAKGQTGKDRYHFVVSNYDAGEWDFATLLKRRPATAAAPELDWLVQAAFEAQHANPDGSKHCAILFVGHADRDDTPGRSPRERVKIEQARSQARAQSARTWLLDQLNARALAAGRTLELDWRGVDNVIVFSVGAGAAELKLEPRTPGDRRFNRRLVIVVEGRNVEAIARHHGHQNELTD